MKSLQIALLAAVACLVSPNSAGAATCSELLRSCMEIVEKRTSQSGEVDFPPTGAPCWYYMSAIQNMSVLENLDGVRLLGICSPPDTTLMDYVRIFAQKAQKRKMQSENAAALTILVLGQRFPCASLRFGVLICLLSMLQDYGRG
jgi:hypothetical protein